MTEPNLPSDGALPKAGSFSVRLTPHRSLSRAGFLLLMGVFGLISFVAGTAFYLIGAWPVLGFFGLDVGLVYLAFRLNYRSGRAFETIEIDGGRMTLTQVDQHGRSRSYEFNPYWVNVRLHLLSQGRNRIALASHGRERSFGAFLTDDEREEFAGVLRAALADARAGPRPTPLASGQ